MVPSLGRLLVGILIYLGTALSPSTGVELAAQPRAAAPPTAVDAALLQMGRQLFLSNYCGVCHALAAADTRGFLGPALNHVATTAVQRIADPTYKGSAVSAEDYLRESIVTPMAYLAPGAASGNHPMPSFAYLADQDIAALVYFLERQK